MFRERDQQEFHDAKELRVIPIPPTPSLEKQQQSKGNALTFVYKGS